MGSNPPQGNPINPIIIPKTADQTISSQTTLQDVTDLVHVLKPSTRYVIEYLTNITSPAAADLDFTFKAISGTAYAEFGLGLGSSATTAFGTEELEVTSGVREQIAGVAWLKTGSGGGTLQLQYAQNVSDAGNTTVHEGAVLLLYILK